LRLVFDITPTSLDLIQEALGLRLNRQHLQDPSHKLFRFTQAIHVVENPRQHEATAHRFRVEAQSFFTDLTSLF
jgi:hypothetical protein